eukprot:6213578-Pleurochrysis_carterae.AAC.1
MAVSLMLLFCVRHALLSHVHSSSSSPSIVFASRSHTPAPCSCHLRNTPDMNRGMASHHLTCTSQTR